MNQQIPTPGRIVTHRDREGRDWPAMITSVRPLENGQLVTSRVNLQVFAEPAVVFRRNIPHTEPFGDGTEPTAGSWRWPERV